MSIKKPTLVHSLSMFQPSLLSKAGQSPPFTSSNTYKPPLFTTSSCNSIPENSRRSTRRTKRQISTMSHSGRRSQFQSRSQSIGGVGAPQVNRLSTHSSQEGVEQKGSLGSIVEKTSSLASFSQHFSSLMSISSQVAQVGNTISNSPRFTKICKLIWKSQGLMILTHDLVMLPQPWKQLPPFMYITICINSFLHWHQKLPSLGMSVYLLEVNRNCLG